MLNSAIQRIKSALASYGWIKSVEFLRFDVVQTDLEKILLYRVRVQLRDGNLLDACERLTAERGTGKLNQTKYHFHWQDNQGNLIRRWDNSPHHPELGTFPAHVHIGPENRCQPSEPLSLPDVLDQIDVFFRDEKKHNR